MRMFILTGKRPVWSKFTVTIPFSVSIPTSSARKLGSEKERMRKEVTSVPVSFSGGRSLKVHTSLLRPLSETISTLSVASGESNTSGSRPPFWVAMRAYSESR